MSFRIDEKTGQVVDVSPWEQSQQDTKDKTYFIKDENGNTVAKKGSELDEKVLNAIVHMKKANYLNILR